MGAWSTQGQPSHQKPTSTWAITHENWSPGVLSRIWGQLSRSESLTSQLIFLVTLEGVELWESTFREFLSFSSCLLSKS